MASKPNIPPMGYYIGPHITIRQIQEATARAFNIAPIEMVSARRAREVVRPRQIAMYLSRELTVYSLPNIGRLFGDRDHTTVMHAIRTIDKLKDIDREMREKVAAVRAELLAEKQEKYKGFQTEPEPEMVAA